MTDNSKSKEGYLQCPYCPNKKTFTGIGRPNKLQCFDCGRTLDIDENYVGGTK